MRSGAMPPTSTSRRSRLAAPCTITRSQLAYSSAHSGAASRERRGSTSCAVKTVAPALAPGGAQRAQVERGQRRPLPVHDVGAPGAHAADEPAEPESRGPPALSGTRTREDGRRSSRPASGGPKSSRRT